MDQSPLVVLEVLSVLVVLSTPGLLAVLEDPLVLEVPVVPWDLAVLGVLEVREVLESAQPDENCCIELESMPPQVCNKERFVDNAFPSSPCFFCSLSPVPTGIPCALPQGQRGCT